MHENRETSEASAAKPGSRSVGEGKRRTARTYVSEESHNGIVPMNHSNKDKISLAESGEGRPLIKENAGQPNTYPTQSGKGVSQGLAGVRKAARENKEMKFTALLHHLTIDLLREGFYSLKRKAAPGLDGVTWYEYEAGIEDRLVDLHSRVHRGAVTSTTTQYPGTPLASPCSGTGCSCTGGTPYAAGAKSARSAGHVCWYWLNGGFQNQGCSIPTRRYASPPHIRDQNRMR